MKIYFIATGEQDVTLRLMSEACTKRGVDYEVLDPMQVNPDDIQIKPGDAVYRMATASHYGATELEWNLIFKGAKSFRGPKNLPLLRGIDLMIFEKAGVPTPKTVPYIPKDRAALTKCVDALGGFPICLKVLGQSHGAGVMRVDSMQSLFSVSDYVRAHGGQSVMKEYCDVTSSARLIVLDGKVIDSIEYSANKGDFRSNEGAQPNVAAKTFSDEVNEIAVRAVESLDLKFGGVDIMITPKGPMVAEVNCPCFFPRCQLLTGTDIAGQMVDYLCSK